MVEYYKLDKICVVGETYTLPPDRFYVIRKIGTNATSATWLKIDGVDTGPIVSDIAPLHTTSSNLLGPLELGDLYYVVPPNKKFWVQGPSGAKVRIVGEIGKLAPGESMPATFASRFDNQGKIYKTYVTGSATLASAGGSWSAGAETEVLSLTPRTIERYLFNDVVMALLSNNATAVSEGMVAVRFFLDGYPLDLLTAEAGRLGIDLFSMPKPPADSTEEEPFTLADRPIEVLGDHTLSVRFVNTSGAAINASSTAAMTGSVWLLCIYQKG
jgi:hypothetical protein